MEHEPEKITEDLLATRLREAEFKVFQQVSCIEQGSWGGERSRGKIDLMALAPAPWSERFGFHAIGFETKKAGLSTGKELVEPVLQSAAYMSSHRFIAREEDGGIFLPRPEVVVIARRKLLETPIEELPEFERGGLLVIERFAWKLGVAILSRTPFGLIRFWSNAHAAGSRTHSLFVARGSRADAAGFDILRGTEDPS